MESNTNINSPIKEKQIPKEIEQDITCPICFEIFKEATIVIPCIHTFCKVCIEQWSSTSKGLCPICKVEIEGLSKNIQLEKIIQNYRPNRLTKSLNSTPTFINKKKEKHNNKRNERKDSRLTINTTIDITSNLSDNSLCDKCLTTIIQFSSLNENEDFPSLIINNLDKLCNFCKNNITQKRSSTASMTVNRSLSGLTIPNTIVSVEEDKPLDDEQLAIMLSINPEYDTYNITPRSRQTTITNFTNPNTNQNRIQVVLPNTRNNPSRSIFNSIRTRLPNTRAINAPLLSELFSNRGPNIRPNISSNESSSSSSDEEEYKDEVADWKNLTDFIEPDTSDSEYDRYTDEEKNDYMKLIGMNISEDTGKKK